MPKKCESCLYFEPNTITGRFEDSFCTHIYTYFNNVIDALKHCDREGDGHFVYFEPKTPAAGAAVSEPPASAGGQFVQITRTHHPRALKAAA